MGWKEHHSIIFGMGNNICTQESTTEQPHSSLQQSKTACVSPEDYLCLDMPESALTEEGPTPLR
jgi:hypothetical protein